MYTCPHRAASILCCGNECLHTELRIRNTCEMVLHEEFYLKPSIRSLLDAEGGIVSKNALVATSGNFMVASTDTSTTDVEFAREVFRLDCLSTPIDGEWSKEKKGCSVIF